MSEQAASILDTAVQGAVGAMANQLPTESKGPEVKVETKIETPKVEEPKVSSKLQIIMQREKQALELERRAKASSSQAELREKQLQEREARVQEFEKLKDTNPMKALELLGLNYTELTNVSLADGNIPPDLKIKKVEEKFDNYLKSKEAEKEEQAKLETKRQEEALDKATAEFKGQIATFVKDNAAKYQYIAFEDATNLVYEVIDEHYNRTMDKATGVGQVMKTADAADRVEAWLEKRDDERRSLDKVKSKLAPQPKQFVVPKQEFEAPRVQKPMRTLTNQQSAVATRPPTKLLTDDERIAKAIAYARGLRP